MGLFDKYETRESLLEAVDQSIRTLPGEGNTLFYQLEPEELPEGELDELRERLERERRTTAEYESRWKESETALKGVREENARLAATNEEFSKYNPEKQRDEINRLLEEVGRLKADNKGLCDQIAPLNQVIADYKRKEDDRTIEKALVDEAAKLGVRPEAMRDVLFRRSMLTVSDIGTVQTKEEGVGIAEFMKSEFDASPLWHPQSQGGGSTSGVATKTTSGELYREAMKNKDFEAMMLNAPEFKGVTLS
jgi:hypothetical protein